MISIKNNVLKRLKMNEHQDNNQAMKVKNIETLSKAMEALTPKGDLFVKLHESIEAQARKQGNMASLEDIKTKIQEVDRFSLKMKGLKLQGVEAVASIKDKKVSFLKDGLFLETYKFLTPKILKKI